MSRRKMRLLCSPTITILSILTILLACGIYILSLVTEGGREYLLENIPMFVLWTLFTCGLSLVTLLAGTRRVFSIITIDETGVSRSFLGKFYKLHISWDEMAEVCYKLNLMEFLFFSKTKTLSDMTYNKAIAVKDAIQISFSKKRYAVIEQYLQNPIVGIPDKVKARLNKRNKNEDCK